MLKRIMLILLALTMALAMTQCGGKPGDDGIPPNTSTEEPTEPSTAAPVTISRDPADYSDTWWQFRGVSTMNVVKDRFSNVSAFDANNLSSSYNQNIAKVMDLAVEVGANYIELNIPFHQRPGGQSGPVTREMLLPYFTSFVEMARERGLMIYWRMAPPREAQNGKEFDFRGMILNKSNDTNLTIQGTEEYFYYIKEFFTVVAADYDLLQPGDILSTWAEGDNAFTSDLGWSPGCARYKVYMRTMAPLVQEWIAEDNLDIIYGESICGGDARIRDLFDAKICEYVDVIFWDHYAGINTDSGNTTPETVERMITSAANTARWIEQYAKAYNVKVSLGEWSTHWANKDKDATREKQAEWITIMMDALSNLSSDYFFGMEYFHFAHPGQTIDFKNASYYYAAFVADAGGKYAGFYALQEAFERHSK